jgi:hypothetical protein
MERHANQARKSVANNAIKDQVQQILGLDKEEEE